MLDRERLWTALLRRLVARLGDHDALMLNGSVGASELYVHLIAARIVARRRHARAVVHYDCSWKLGAVFDRVACDVPIRVVDSPAITYCVLSSEEREVFPRTWGVDPDRVAFTPYCDMLSGAALAAPVSEGGGVFGSR